MRVLTVGHSNHALDEFLGLLHAHDVTHLADVRRVPRSTRHPWFASQPLAAALERAGVAYLGMPGLGGLREPEPDSINRAWREPAFRGFADYMQSAAFGAQLDELLAVAREHRAAVMCAEALPEHCHRSLIADALVARGVPVAHIVGPGEARPHVLSAHARLAGERVSYPAPDLFGAS